MNNQFIEEVWAYVIEQGSQEETDRALAERLQHVADIRRSTLQARSTDLRHSLTEQDPPVRRGGKVA